MHFTIIDTESIYRRLLTAPHAAAREAIFRAEIIAPFKPLTAIFGGGDELVMFNQWGMSPEQFASGSRDKTQTLIDTLAAHDAWAQAAQALEDGRRAFVQYESQTALDNIIFALMAVDMPGATSERGYSGFGGFPGYIMTAYGDANDYTLPRIKAATVHELHHNIRFTLFPFNMMTTTLADYIIAEGLAESFAAELYGEGVVEFFVNEFDESRLDETRHKIRDALDVTGFNVLRAYIFGDSIAAQYGLQPAGVPDYAGYAIGYRIVQAYLQRTGKTIAGTTMLPSMEIIRASGYFS